MSSNTAEKEIVNGRIIVRDFGLGYRINGWIRNGDTFNGELVFPVLRQGLTTTFVLPEGTFGLLESTFRQYHEYAEDWIYHLVVNDEPEKSHWLVRRSEVGGDGVDELNRLLLPLHQLALLQQSTLKRWHQEPPAEEDGENKDRHCN